LSNVVIPSSVEMISVGRLHVRTIAQDVEVEWELGDQIILIEASEARLGHVTAHFVRSERERERVRSPARFELNALALQTGGFCRHEVREPVSA
jgi:hypothetical protein